MYVFDHAVYGRTPAVLLTVYIRDVYLTRNLMITLRLAGLDDKWLWQRRNLFFSSNLTRRNTPTLTKKHARACQQWNIGIQYFDANNTFRKIFGPPNRFAAGGRFQSAPWACTVLYTPVLWPKFTLGNPTSLLLLFWGVLEISSWVDCDSVRFRPFAHGSDVNSDLCFA